ncbi:trypsin-like peptidase domain-containing protein [Yoonia sp. F2084L]|uniref:trypsin-like peptidase domain-containing protein n=1 Tax=Yoonia sp. F2084L TaxID=2926419 RepID=UPI001FF52647|nr:trypsin-like peptidase domain-containing protein [Yoonia sp. F2084L]MCK0095639.1 trypsin-like peptidase domain-containing protein [Yoonia sp. F2084L]
MSAALRIFFVCLCCIFHGSPGLAQDDRLVAMVRIYIDDELDRVGAAILVADQNNALTMVTAAHTLADVNPDLGDRISVEFLSEAATQFDASIEAVWLQEDFAAITVELPADSPALQDFRDARAVLLPGGLQSEAGDALYGIGFPGERAWFGNRRPDILRAVEDTLIIYESTVTVPGMSGGALFGDHGALLGMVQNVSRTQARALSIGAVQEAFLSRGLPFSLSESKTALPALLSPKLQRLGSGADAVARAAQAEMPVFPDLHVFWAGGVDASFFADALSRRVTGSDMSVFEHIAQKSAVGQCLLSETATPDRADTAMMFILFDTGLADDTDCQAHYGLWITKVLEAGLDPDLLITDRDGHARALLNMAIRDKSFIMTRALIQGGAAPNAYQDLNGRRGRRSIFTHPLEAVASQFADRDAEVLWSALVDAGAVLLENPADAGTLSFPEPYSAPPSAVEPLCTRRDNQLGTAWCAAAEVLPPNFGLRAPEELRHNQVTHEGFAAFGPLLFATETQAYFSAWAMHVYSGKRAPLVIEITPATGKWRALFHSESYGCRIEDDGYEPSTCWRGFHAFSQVASASADPAMILTEDDIASQISIQGIRPGMSVEDAQTILVEAGYQPEFGSSPEDYGDLIVAFDFRRSGASGTVAVIAMANQIVGIAAAGPSADLKLTGLDALDALATDPQAFLHRSADPTRPSVRARREQAEGAWAFSFETSSRQPPTARAFLYQRMREETLSEVSFWMRQQDKWLGQKDAAEENLPCSDAAADVRLFDLQPCPTHEDLTVHLAENFGSSIDAVTLPDGVLYKVVTSGEGETIALGDTVGLSYTSQIWGLRKVSDSGSASMIAGSTDWRTKFYDDLLPRLRRGDVVEVFVPPDTWNAYMGESTEFHRRVPTVFKIRIAG